MSAPGFSRRPRSNTICGFPSTPMTRGCSRLSAPDAGWERHPDRISPRRSPTATPWPGGWISRTLRTGDRDQAVADFNSTLKQLPKNAWALYGRGVAKERQGKTAEAQGDMAAATALQPEIADTFKKRGITP